MHLHHADRQQARPALAQRGRGAAVHHDPPAARLGVPKPELETRYALLLLVEARSLRLSRDGPHDRPGLCSVGDHRLNPRRRRHLRRHDLRAHAAGPEGRGRDPDLETLHLREVPDLGHERRRRVVPRIRGVQPIDVRQHQQQVRVDQDRHLRGQEVVVAERDLVGRRRVVLIDHRRDAPVEQRAQGLARVEVVAARRHVEESEEHLRARDAPCREELVVVAIELPLTDRGRRLQIRHRGGPHWQLHQPHPARDRPRRDEHHRVALGVESGHLLADRGENVLANLAALVGDDARSELDNCRAHAARRLCRPLAAQRSGAAGSSSKTTPPISTSSPGVKPAASRASITPIALRRSST